MILKRIEPGEGRRELAFPLFVLGLFLLAWAPSCGEAPPPATPEAREPLRIQGSTMGTTWSASMRHSPFEQDWQALFQAELDAIESALTTWDPESELMRFNAWQPETLPDYFPAGEHFVSCFLLGQQLNHATRGAFDPSIQPIVDLWGFGSERERPLPTEEQLQAARAQSALPPLGYDPDRPEGHIPKLAAGTSLDFSAHAKGYAADRLAAMAEKAFVGGALIEVGGEIRVVGNGPHDGKWRIGIEAPAEHPGAPKVIGTVLTLSGYGLSAVATSGDSRNRRTIGDFTFSHIIDPRTGWPLEDPPASVTVIARDCATADAWATALMVLGPEEGLTLAQEAGLEVCFQLRQEDGSFREVATEGYEALVVERLNR